MLCHIIRLLIESEQFRERVKICLAGGGKMAKTKLGWQKKVWGVKNNFRVAKILLKMAKNFMDAKNLGGDKNLHYTR